MVFGQTLGQIRIGKKRLHTALCIVEAPFDAYDVRVARFVARHLESLYGAYAAGRIKNDDTDARHVRKSSKRGLAGVSGCGHQYDELVVDTPAFSGEPRESSHESECEILECQSGAVEQLEKVIRTAMQERSYIGRIEAGRGGFDRGFEVGAVKFRGKREKGPEMRDRNTREVRTAEGPRAEWALCAERIVRRRAPSPARMASAAPTGDASDLVLTYTRTSGGRIAKERVSPKGEDVPRWNRPDASSREIPSCNIV